MQYIRCNVEDLNLVLSKPINIGNDMVFGNFNPYVHNNYQSQISNYVRDLNAYYQSDEYLQRANELMLYREDNYLDMTIYIINSIDQVIGVLMQQYIMACPTIAQAYDDGLINGFPNGYQHDYYMPYKDRKNYENVMDGIGYEEDDTIYADIIQDDEEDMSLGLDDQDKILLTWDYVKSLIRQGQDPTDLTTTEDRE